VWLRETDSGWAREDNANEKRAAMASADGRAFMKLYRKLRSRACTANLGVEEPRAPERCCSSQLRPGRGPLSDGRQTLFGYLAVFGSLDLGKQLLLACAMETGLQHSVWGVAIDRQGSRHGPRAPGQTPRLGGGAALLACHWRPTRAISSRLHNHSMRYVTT
jgi:hypothetical protein